MDYVGIAALLASISGGGFLLFAMNNLNKKLERLDLTKQDKSVCTVSHIQIEKDLVRGQENFKQFQQSIDELKYQLSKNNTLLALLTQEFKQFAGHTKRHEDDGADN